MVKKKKTQSDELNVIKKKLLKDKVSKDPMSKLKPFDLILYSVKNVMGEFSEPETHLVLPSEYDRDPELAGYHPTLRILDDTICSSSIHFIGAQEHKIEVISNKRLLKLEAFNKILSIAIKNKHAVN